MKTLLAMLAALALGSAAATAKTLEITVEDVRSDKGQILVMAAAAGQEQPVYGKADAKKGSVVVTLTASKPTRSKSRSSTTKTATSRLKTGSRGPQEGYAARKCKLPADTNAAKLRLYYPAPENE